MQVRENVATAVAKMINVAVLVAKPAMTKAECTVERTSHGRAMGASMEAVKRREHQARRPSRNGDVWAWLMSVQTSTR